MRTIYAIGDIHGQMEALTRALDLIHDDGGAEADIVFLGDYTDRGPDSRGVVETLIDGISSGKNWRAIRGNHDRLFSNFVRHAITTDPRIKSPIAWLNPRLGGQTTLRSYFDLPEGAEYDPYGYDGAFLAETQALSDLAKQHVPTAHLDFLDALPLTIEDDGLFFVHAGIDPKRPFGMQDPEDLLWIRDGWLDFTGPLRHLVVHGHTALDTPQHHGNRVNLDGGAGYGRPLVPTAIEIADGRHRFFTLSEAGRTPLVRA